MSVAENESTSKSAQYGVGVDAISNPESGTNFGEATSFGGPITIRNSNMAITGVSGGGSGITITNAGLSIIGASGTQRGVSGSMGSGYTGFILTNANAIITGASGGATGLTVQHAGITLTGRSGDSQVALSVSGALSVSYASGVTFTGPGPVVVSNSGQLRFLAATSGTIVAGSGTSISGLIPQGFITVMVSGVIGKIPYFGET